MKKTDDDRKQESQFRQEGNRFEESRELEDREAVKRNIMNMKYRDSLYVDPANIPPDVDYRWFRESCYGKPDDKRMVDSRRLGWTPVPSSRHPDMVYKDFFGRNDHMNSYIYYQGLILCERSKELGKLEQQRVDTQNYRIMTSMPGIENLLGEPTITVNNASQTYMTKAASFAGGG